MHIYPWTEESVMFMCRAAERSDYHAVLCERIRAHLSGQERIYEPGCGTGELSLALAPYVASLTAADIHPLPLHSLRERAKARGLGNITVLEQDAFSLPAEARFDAAVFCFFGMPEEILSFCRAHVSGRVFIIKRAYPNHRFSQNTIPITGDSLSKMCALLTKSGIPFEREDLSLSMDQPLRDLQEARRFFALYRQDDDAVPLSDAFLLSRLTKRDDPEYPYLLTGTKQIGLICFDSQALRQKGE